MDFKKIEAKIKTKTIIDPNTKCWLYTGTINNRGYGQVKIDYINHFVHRISAAIYLNYDLLDKDNQILHKKECPNKNCWNPAHLYVGTEFENKIDRLIKFEEHRGYNQHTFQTHCKWGHDISTPDKYYKYKHGRKCKQCEKDRYNLLRGK